MTNEVLLALPKSVVPSGRGVRGHSRQRLHSLFLLRDKHDAQALTLHPAPTHKSLKDLTASLHHEVSFSAQGPPGSVE